MKTKKIESNQKSSFNFLKKQVLNLKLLLTLTLFCLVSLNLKAQTWSKTGSVTTARFTHTTTLLANNNVLVTGGNSKLSSCEIYDFSVGTWASTGSLNTGREEHTAVLLGTGKVLAIGGYNSGSLSSSEIWDPNTNTWSNTGSLISARRNHTATVLLDGKVLVTGGRGSSGNLSSCELYDPTNAKWSSTGSMSSIRFFHTASLLSDGKVLVTGGNNGTNGLATCEIYDPTKGTWSSTGSMSVAHERHTITLLNSGLYLVTEGLNGANTSNSCELYDPRAGSWKNTGAMTTARFFHTATLLSSGMVLVAGGGDASQTMLSSCELYDPNSGTWSNTGSLSIAHAAHGAVLLSTGFVLVTAGVSTGFKATGGCELYGAKSCIDPTVPTILSKMGSDKNGIFVSLSLSSATLNSATDWQWYIGSCGGTSVGSGKNLIYYLKSNTTFYVRGEGGCVKPGTCAKISITLSEPPTTPTLAATASTICIGSSTSLSIDKGTLNSATDWFWYSGTCGGTYIGKGTSISVSPTETTTYYARGEGTDIGSCGSITVTVTNDVYTGNAILQTQAQMNSFVSGGGCKYTKIDGILILDGGNSSDPITNLSNLSILKEVTGNMTIRNFNKSGNPTDLKYLSQFKDAGGQLNIVSNSKLQNVTLPKLAIVWNGFTIHDNTNLTYISMPKLYNVKFNLKITDNPHTESILFSNDTSFVTSRAGLDVEISNNGGSAANPLTMEFKKISRFNNLIFDNNDNTGVSDFDNIFSGITAAKTLTVTNNDYLAACCKVASCVVSVGRTLTGNTGDCADLSAVTTACGTLHKMSPKASVTLNKETSFNVYPNPAKGQFNLHVSPSGSGIVNLTVTDMMGRMVLSQNYTVNSDTNISLNMDLQQKDNIL